MIAKCALLVTAAVLIGCASSGPTVSPTPTAGAAGQPTPDPAAQFAYDAAAPLDVRTDAATSIPGGTIATLSFASPKAGRASGFIALPSGSARVPAVVLMPGSNAGPSEMRSTALELVKRGIAAISIDQSQTRSGHRPLFTFTLADRDESVATVIDLRRAIDVLTARSDIDATRLGYWGFSHGAFLGGILAGVDKRVRAYVLQSGGGADYMLQNAPRQISDATALAQYRTAIASIDPDVFVARAAPAALLIQNGSQDSTYTEAGVVAWAAAASEPKLVKRYTGGHMLDASANADAFAFLEAALTTAAPPATLQGARGVVAEQRVTRAPGTYYVRLVSLDGATAVDTADEVGFTLVVSDTHRWFIGIRPAERRTRPLTAGTKVLYESADLPPSAVPPGGFADALVVLVLVPGQIVPAHMHGGIEPTYVIEGTIELRVKGQPIQTLSAGEGANVLPDTPLLITNVGPSVARVLVMLATPDGKAVQSQTANP